MSKATTSGRGRCLGVQGAQITLRTESGPVVVQTQNASLSWLGQIVEVLDGQGHILTPNRAPELATTFMNHVLDPRRLRAIGIRSQVESGIRDFLQKNGFRETRTPLLVPSPGMEPHIRPFEVIRPAANPDAPSLPAAERIQYLPTSPEFAMKRLLVGGLEKIFQICPAFRDEPRSSTHRPEFTMLEWYRAYAGYEDIMQDTEELVESLARRIHGQPHLTFQGRQISVEAPWPRYRIRDLFMEYADVDLTRAADAPSLAGECVRLGLQMSPVDTWDDLYFRIWLNLIEPRLPVDRAVFVTRYPASQAALAVVDLDPDGSPWARRFEAYAGGIELGNAFEELTDPTEQRRRFEKDMELRQSLYGADFPRSPLDEGFLEALHEGLPPSGGIAMGVDRLVMLLSDEPEIDFTFWL